MLLDVKDGLHEGDVASKLTQAPVFANQQQQQMSAALQKNSTVNKPSRKVANPDLVNRLKPVVVDPSAPVENAAQLSAKLPPVAIEVPPLQAKNASTMQLQANSADKPNKIDPNKIPTQLQDIEEKQRLKPQNLTIVEKIIPVEAQSVQLPQNS